VGLVISQCRGNPDYFEALDLLELGLDPKRALNRLRSEDQRQFNKLSRSRQVAVIDSQGKIDSFTGEDCGRYAGQIVNKQLGYVLLGNGLESQEVLIAMDKEMRRQELGSFERIALAMQAGLRAGGEVRPESSAGLCYASGTSSSKWWKDSGECLSIEDSDTPVMDLIKLFNLEQSRLALEKGFESFEGGDFDSGSDAFEIAKRLNPTDMEIPLWQGFFLYKSGRKAKGLKILRPIIESNDPWPKETLRRFGGSVGDELLEKMLSAEKK
ncbi:MAG: DUF1028 domain-containing protein, partial [Bdellovibrionales bacterium]|nr:DUF1028 domain-containing protein [Bdellovibrionales bacterium]